MRPAERNSLTDSVLNEAVTTEVAAVMARKVSTSEGFAKGIASALARRIDSDPQARRLLVSSALSSQVLKEALIRKIQRELRQPPR